MASRLVGDETVIEEEPSGVRRRWRIVPLDEPRGRLANAEEQAETAGVPTRPPPFSWGVDKRFRPMPRRGAAAG